MDEPSAILWKSELVIVSCYPILAAFIFNEAFMGNIAEPNLHFSTQHSNSVNKATIFKLTKGIINQISTLKPVAETYILLLRLYQQGI